jgi:hypothetical protein
MNDVVHSFVSCAKHEFFQATPCFINDMMGDDGGRGEGMMCLLSIRSSSSSDNICTHTVGPFFLGRCANFFVAKNNRPPLLMVFSSRYRYVIWVTCTLSCTHTHTQPEHFKHGYGSGTSFRNSFHTHTHTTRAFQAWIWVRTQLEKFLSHTHTHTSKHFKHGYGSGPSLRNSFQW